MGIFVKQSVEFEIGVKPCAKAGAIPACADTEGNFTIHLTWKLEQPPPTSKTHLPSTKA